MEARNHHISVVNQIPEATHRIIKLFTNLIPSFFEQTIHSPLYKVIASALESYNLTIPSALFTPNCLPASTVCYGWNKLFVFFRLIAMMEKYRRDVADCVMEKASKFYKDLPKED
ncbi:hypothetical protein NE237_033145 [Protea cynaroides]|uniref:Uncharacterized protein n=1 Tax=Protea cynaroides TaxID=273540 RepID=A0A9Q0L4B4_9MAGN|nr:hypothetical protein NE237_033145 [Protea cynaroides]